jgi:hypothetical protein
MGTGEAYPTPGPRRSVVDPSSRQRFAVAATTCHATCAPSIRTTSAAGGTRAPLSS